MSVLLFDGAFGTYYSKISGAMSLPELANRDDADTVARIHAEYISAGAQAIKTNTFGANSEVLGSFNDAAEMISRGFEIAALAASGSNTAVFADIGPMRESYAAREEYVRICELFLSLGADSFLFETLSDARDVCDAVEYIKSRRADARIITSFAVSRDGYTKTGGYYKELFSRALLAGSDHVGLNCICGPAHMLELIKSCDAGLSVSAMPNSGYPSCVNGRTVYIDNPEYFASKLRDIYIAGADILGGCCGSTPDHIRAAAALLAGCDDKERMSAVAAKKAERSKEQAFAQDHPVIAVELHPPVDTDVSYVLRAAIGAKNAGADYVTLPDSPLARTSADSLMLASKIKRETEISVIPHITCRDRNQIAIKGGLLAANIEGIDNVLAITGDAVTETQRQTVRHASGFDSLKLISFISRMNEDVFAARPFKISAALNTSSPKFDLELERARRKIDCGCEALFSQPVFSEWNIENLRRARSELDCKLMCGIMPVASYKNALFLNNEVPGIDIPPELIESLRCASPEEVKKLSIEYCGGIADAVSRYCDGYYIITPLKRIDFSIGVIEYIRGKDK